LLFDSTLCVGCKACVTACKIANTLPLDVPPDKPYLDQSQDIGPKVFNVIKMYKDGGAAVKDREADGFAFIKKSCMHCVDPSCVSVCPVSAMRKDPVTGIVTYDKDACIGCRYCVASCPFRIPRSDYDTPTPEIHKCQLCRHLHAEGKFSACADACPTGATLYGPVELLKAEAKRRVALSPGEKTRFPRRSIEIGENGRERAAPQYLQHIYGEHEGGGTQMLMLSAVPFEKLGLPILPRRSYASVSESIQHGLYAWLALPALALAGLMSITRRTARHDDDETGPETKP
ncbi:MAG: hydrogenase 2 operon protein HybA, partial [Rhodospirillales bacterium]|nr:hydrogenase 2 operon protein HybA [Rhodospirillales bacterium]